VDSTRSGSGAGSATSCDVIVIGGGFAGVVAARELARAGRRAVLLEARDRLGGRTWYRELPGAGRKVELGGTWISSRTMRCARAEVERYGLRLTRRDGAAPVFRWSLGDGLVPGFPLAGEELYELERAWFELILRARRIDPDRPLDGQSLADLDVSVAALLHGLGLSTRVRAFLDIWARLGSGCTSEEWSGLQLLAWIAALDWSVLGYFAEVSEVIETGTASLLEAIVADADVEIRLSEPVAAIRDAGDEVVVRLVDGGELRAGAAVVAVPVNLWSSIDFGPPLAGARLELAAAGHPGRMQKVWVHARGAPANLVALGSETGFVWLSAEYPVGGDEQLLVGFASPPSGVDPADADAVGDAVRALAPEADVIGVASHDWSADPWSRGTWMVPRSSWLSRSWSEVQAPVGRLAFAGADIATRWVGWIDGAVESGHRATADVLAMPA